MWYPGSLQARRGQLDRLTAIESGLDDVRGEEGKRQRAADVRLMHTVPATEVCNRSHAAASKLVEPAMTLRNSGDKRGVGIACPGVLSCDHQLELGAASAKPYRYVQPRHAGIGHTWIVVCSENRVHGFDAESDADSIPSKLDTSDRLQQ
jgi:hypothetical protein